MLKGYLRVLVQYKLRDIILPLITLGRQVIGVQMFLQDIYYIEL
jgi:hypothetical protein